MFSRRERVEIFMSRFHGRQDVFARRWERPNGASGYAPVYVDSNRTSYQERNTLWIAGHLIGTETLSVYPLLPEEVPPRKFGKAAPARRSLGAGGESYR